MADRHAILTDCAQCAAYLRTSLAHPVQKSSDLAAKDARAAAVLIPLFVGSSGEPRLLFTVRAATLRRHRGEISFPGGKRDAGDATLAETALREAQEEIGLAPTRVTLLGELPDVFTVVSNYLITPYLALLDGTLADIAPAVNVDEVAELINAPLAALADPAIMHTEEWERDGVLRLVYFYQYGAHTIWGATAHILTALLALLPP